MSGKIFVTSYIIHPTPYTIHLTPYTLHHTPFTNYTISPLLACLGSVAAGPAGAGAAGPRPVLPAAGTHTRFSCTATEARRQKPTHIHK
ncbi:hypothetical protein EON65_31610 [archaeon]|nr:MAG: hypothetical protein EON65_31610 [archaeon]